MSECRGWDLNPRTTKDKALNLAPLTMLGYPCIADLTNPGIEQNIK